MRRTIFAIATLFAYVSMASAQTLTIGNLNLSMQKPWCGW